MRKIVILTLGLLLSVGITQSAYSHGGGLDWQGGHNCRVGSCAGTYHCHQARAGICASKIKKPTSNEKKPSKSR